MNKIRQFYPIVIVVYTFILMYLMLFGFGRTQDEFKQIQLIPFQTISSFLFFQAGFFQFFINIICNILLFIPFGFLGLIHPKLNNLKNSLFLFWMWLIPMEFLQYITGRGMADVDDFMLNSIGLLIGFYLMKSSPVKLNQLNS